MNPKLCPLWLFFYNLSFASPSFEILRTCIDLKPQNSSIKITELVDGREISSSEKKCENLYGEQLKGHFYGMVTCNDVFYLIINDQKIKTSSAINGSVNPEIKPGNILSNRALWHKIDMGDKSYLCIQAPISESGAGSSDSQYYIVENAFTEKGTPIAYYYFFNKEIVPITSEHF